MEITGKNDEAEKHTEFHITTDPFEAPEDALPSGHDSWLPYPDCLAPGDYAMHPSSVTMQRSARVLAPDLRKTQPMEPIQDPWKKHAGEDQGLEPKNNDGRPTCYWCGSPTKNVQGAMSHYDICTKKGCER